MKTTSPAAACGRQHDRPRQMVLLMLTTALLLHADRQLTAQSPKASASAAELDLLRPDEVMSRDTKMVRVGEIRFATDNGIDFKEKNKLAVLLSPDDYQIQFWNGVTNAADILSAAIEQVAVIKDSLDDHRFGDSDLKTTNEVIVAASKQATTLFDAIFVFARKDDISRLPEIPELSREDIDAIQAAAVEREALLRLDIQIENAAEDRKEVQALQRSQLRLILLGLKVRRFQDVALQCQRVSMQMTSRMEPSAMERQFGLAADELEQLCGKLHVTGPYVAKLPPLNSLPAVAEATEQLLPALADIRSIRILGPEVLELLNAIHDEHVVLGSNLQKMETLALPLQDIARAWQVLGESAEQASIASLEDFTTQYTEISTKLDDFAKAIQPDRDQPAAAVVLAAAAAFKRELEDSRDLLALQVELPLVDSLLKEARLVATDDDARTMAVVLDQRHSDMSRYLKLGQRVNSQNRRRLDLVLTALKSAAARCRNDALRIVIDSTSASLVSLHKLNMEVIQQATSTRTSESTEFVAAVTELQQSITELSDDFTRASKREPELPDEAVQLQTGIDNLKAEIDQGLLLLTIQQHHRNPLPDNPSEEDVKTLAAALSTSRDQMAALAPSVRSELKELYVAVDVMIRSRASELQIYRTRLDLDQAVSTLNSQFDDIKGSIVRGNTSGAGSTMYTASRALDALRKTISADKLLADDTQRTKQVEQLGTRLDTLASELAEQCRKDRDQAGWLTLADERGTQVPPLIENRWLAIEVLISRQQFDEASDMLGRISDSVNDPASLQRAYDLRATIQFKQARFNETNGNSEAALSQFRRLADLEGLHGRAASAAVLNLSQQILQKTDSSGVLVRSIAVLTFSGAICLFAVLVLRTESVPGRIKQARSTLAKFRSLDQKSAQAAVIVREKVAVLLASLPDDHPELQRFQDDLRVGELKGMEVVVPPKPCNDVAVPAYAPPRQHDVIATIIALEMCPDEHVIQQVIDWLADTESQDRSARQIRRASVQWLKAQLLPVQQDLPTVLHCKARLTAQCRGAATKSDPWPFLYELRALLLVGNWQSAVALAKAIPLKGTHQTLVSEAVVAVTRCHVELKQWAEAVQWYRDVRARAPKHVRKELQYWASIAVAQRAITSSESPTPQLLAQFTDTLTNQPSIAP